MWAKGSVTYLVATQQILISAINIHQVLLMLQPANHTTGFRPRGCWSNNNNNNNNYNNNNNNIIIIILPSHL